VSERRGMLRSLPATVWLLGAISLLNDAASELVYPLIPLYLATVLGAGPRTLGAIEGAASAASALLKLVSGLAYDRYGRAKPFIVVGYGLAAVARPAIAFVSVWPLLLALRVADRVGKGLRSSPRDALLARSVDASMRGTAFGLHRAMDNAGAVIGPLIAAGLLALAVPVRDILLWAAVPGVLCVVLALVVREIPSAKMTATTAPPPLEWTWRGLPADFKRLLAAVALFTCGDVSYAFFLLSAIEAGMPATQVALLWATVAAAATLLALPLSRLSDRIGRTRQIAAGWTLYAAIFIALALARDPVFLWPLAVLLGIYMAATEGTERALIADVVPPARLGAAYGWYYLVKGLLLLPASAAFGWLWHAAGAATSFLVAAAIAVAAALLLQGWAGPDT